MRFNFIRLLANLIRKLNAYVKVLIYSHSAGSAYCQYSKPESIVQLCCIYVGNGLARSLYNVVVLISLSYHFTCPF